MGSPSLNRLHHPLREDSKIGSHGIRTSQVYTLLVGPLSALFGFCSDGTNGPY